MLQIIINKIIHVKDVKNNILIFIKVIIVKI